MCKILDQLRADFCAYLDDKHLFQYSEIISLDASLRREGLSALQWLDGFSETFSRSGFKGNFTRPSGKRHSVSDSIDHLSPDMVNQIPSNIPERAFPARVYIFEDNEIVMRIIIRGRGPNYVSRIHRVDWTWLFERSNLDRLISIRKMCTAEQLADMWTKGAFSD